jgi:hypothetical protein
LEEASPVSVEKSWFSFDVVDEVGFLAMLSLIGELGFGGSGGLVSSSL